ncbi:uncharacterized protein Eint_060680 [Encephalitozoon intestinalis ATCC 50506]|uniref:Uncharacterized protein n=1 Tax=Encephalitozoon intestinalis (strain ATCC 50506) TaxID=876142 RepID=E0S7J7_ENCIT|nr:uncharacterized protein Eint_060680 [Encephalitozoon intestinalis ATCC 50506]ADM11676.1 hypothetical protein Eint_060680 [Encephalitozoon intestinalis ATCC 50506]UTX45413.1 hypothetical protein GPK93_06g09650 [Encephalitozoon intestinalis]
METARKIRRHKILAYALTAVEAMGLSVVVKQAVRNPLRVLLNPPKGLVRGLCSIPTIMLWIAIYIYLSGKVAQEAGRPRTVIFFYHLTSQIMFLGYLSKPGSDVGMNSRWVTLIPTNGCSVYSVALSISSATLQTYIEEILWMKPRYTRVRGLFNYMGRSIGVMVRDMFYLCIGSEFMAIGALTMCLVVSKTLFPWSRLGPFWLFQGTAWRMSGGFLAANISTAAYFLLMSAIDRLLTYNMSLMNLGLGDYCCNEEESINTSRLRFFQISELSMKYPEVFKKVARSNKAVSSLGLYVRREEREILKIMETMRRERETLESRMWFSVPQITQPLDKPKALVVQRKVQFVKRIRSYNFIEILASRIVYFFKIRILINRYKGTRRPFLLVKSFMKFLEKYRRDYLLLKDLDETFEASMKNLHNEISNTEEVIGIGLESELFCK